jgi:glycosyltransferase involved in cell wall biosynthesis
LTKQFILGHNLPDSIKLIEVSTSPKKLLGELRNIAIENASGSFVCQWDDDDWFHAERLAYQYSVIRSTAYSACVMTQWLVFDNTRGNAYLSNRRLWEGSVMCHKEVIRRKQYESVKIGEDTAVIDYLKENNHIYEVNDNAGLYIYIYHGANTWNAPHWERIFRYSELLQPGQSARISQVLKGDYSNLEASQIIDHLIKPLINIQP